MGQKNRIAVNSADLIFAQCNGCKHRKPYKKNLKSIHCEAFKNIVIPDEILENKHDHKTPYPGDNGIMFEPIDSN